MDIIKVLLYINITASAFQNKLIAGNLTWKHTGIATYINLDSIGTDTIWKLQNDLIILDN
jgi:hypothetical protein